jgi:hypothetical protein
VGESDVPTTQDFSAKGFSLFLLLAAYRRSHTRAGNARSKWQFIEQRAADQLDVKDGQILSIVPF